MIVTEYRIILSNGTKDLSAKHSFLISQIKWIAIASKKKFGFMICTEGLPTFYLSTKYRNEVIEAIRVLYTSNVCFTLRTTVSDNNDLEANLPIYSIPTKDLSKYSISKEDAMKGRYRFPENEYLIDPPDDGIFRRSDDNDSNEDLKDETELSPNKNSRKPEDSKSKNNIKETSSRKFSSLANNNAKLKKLYGTEFIITSQEQNKLETSELTFRQSSTEKLSQTYSGSESLRRLSTSYISQSSGDDEPEPEPETFRGHKPIKSENPTLNDFILLKLLGEGSYGKVFLVKNTLDDKFYAMKRIRKDVIIEDKQIQFMKDKDNKKICYLSEIFIMKEAQNPFLVNLRYIFESEYRIYLIMDYFPGGDLFTQMRHFKRFTEEQVKFIAAEVAIAFGSLHKNNIIHRDLKPENLLVDEEGYCYLTDFGLSKVLQSSDDLAQTLCGTPDYTAPEVIKGDQQSFTVDWWTLGVLIFELLCELLSTVKIQNKMDRNIVKAKIFWPDPDKSKIEISDEARDLIKSLLQPDPSKRLGHKGIIQVLKHKWFEDIDKDDLLNKEIESPINPVIDHIDENDKDISEAISNYYEMKEKGFKKSAYSNQDLLESSIVESRKKMVQKNKYVNKLVK